MIIVSVFCQCRSYRNDSDLSVVGSALTVHIGQSPFWESDGACGQVLWSVNREGWCLWTGQKGGIVVGVWYFTLKGIFIQENKMFHCARTESVSLDRKSVV